MFVMSAFHPSFVHNLHKPFNKSVEFRVHCVVLVCWLSKLGWKGLMTYLTKILFLCDSWTKLDGIFGKMQIIKYFQNPKAYLAWFISLKVIDAKSPVVIFFGDNLYRPFITLHILSSSPPPLFFWGGGGVGVNVQIFKKPKAFSIPLDIALLNAIQTWKQP